MIRINLLKPEKKEGIVPERVEREKKATTLPLFFFAAVVVAGVLLFFQQSELKTERKLLKAAQEEKQKLKEVESKLERVEKQRGTIIKKIDLINQLKLNQDTAVRIMEELSKNIPSWVSLSETNFDGRVVRIRGKALTNKLIADYLDNLEKIPFFRNITLISSIQRVIQNNRFFAGDLPNSCGSPLSATSPQLGRGKPPKKGW